MIWKRPLERGVDTRCFGTSDACNLWTGSNHTLHGEWIQQQSHGGCRILSVMQYILNVDLLGLGSNCDQGHSYKLSSGTLHQSTFASPAYPTPSLMQHIQFVLLLPSCTSKTPPVRDITIRTPQVSPTDQRGVSILSNMALKPDVHLFRQNNYRNMTMKTVKLVD